MSDHDALREQAIAAELDEHGDLAPPWARCPEIPCGSIGWRMGHGESWMVLWGEWLARQPRDREWRAAYLRRHPQAPRSWSDWVLRVLAVEFEDDFESEFDDEQLAQLDALGLVGDDVAIVAWERLQGSSPTAPWVEGGSVRSCVRYGAREFDFWVRWWAKRRADGSLAAWLKTAPPAPEDWEVVREAAATGVAPAMVRGDPFERMGVLMAAHGQPPAPWRVGEEPAAPDEDAAQASDEDEDAAQASDEDAEPAASDEDDDAGEDDEEKATYTSVWDRWALYRFDDAATWQAYLRAQGPCPPEWAETVAGMLTWLR
ncbi:hypothetical protein [Nannocystis radixulma]|uniref:Uncharacterized protein n=1 Tax=Nannocystis radixulma TaxID=2995305 RepID=A0ABT5B7J5_9BACT|nr:hypothetical protein [Nannocystis radixulma]MDC0670095.1 hypothetical protein [Nannocystis radixulma]